MAHDICPWWLGYVLASPIRKIWQDPYRILSPHVHTGMTVLEPGPGMGFFTLELARLVGPSGRVIAVDVQPKMLNALARKAEKLRLADRIVALQAKGDNLGVEDYAGKVDFVLAFAVVHELPSIPGFFQEAATALKSGGKMLLCEPSGHVDQPAWEKTLESARSAGLSAESTLKITSSHAAILIKA
jgi:ubiquinone/menaquinone biosynthesis C-methylase UbiE